MNAIETNSLAVERGYTLTKEDILIRDTIDEIMCNGTIDFVEIAENHTCSLPEFLAITKFDKSKIATLIEDKLVELTGATLRVTDAGMMVVRNVAAAFDPNFVPAANKYSTTI